MSYSRIYLDSKQLKKVYICVYHKYFLSHFFSKIVEVIIKTNSVFYITFQAEQF